MFIYLSILSFLNYPTTSTNVNRDSYLLSAALVWKERFNLKRKVKDQEIVRWRIKVGQIGAFNQLKDRRNKDVL